MPELPEVETTRRGISPHIKNQKIADVIVRQPKLRWPVRDDLPQLLKDKELLDVTRRAKYLLLTFPNGTLIGHLGMSGSMRILPASTPAEKHDHVDIVFANGKLLRLTDPRRFGALLWAEGDPNNHKVLAELGPEPLSEEFSGDRLYQRSRSRRQAVKTFIMDNHNVVGVGNIYASEALFMAGIRPDIHCGKISRQRYDKLAQAIKKVLERAITVGGTTLKDFVGGDGKPGYFAIELTMYGRSGEPCKTCGTTIKEIKLSNRASCYCPECQK
ncbi:bifunctional DNA-formamidopyrimidine glycosylase/DNA-(apurinic or apyrimidinic site) lyase [Sansalvadorimonas sp. 2012CJ34-2]|uniref:Formamidopyrimidine-DNA glycosylase n=1 Tax=Parendozoicomonas callyspongiae TaxID=2942213 RepID=A0ABT0PHF9_9GAMM|nr:bifunctional DNA-formamidopyrimidine glycosylase/DNA-(apurinic or apyrimidinic site) lyase [Sansalvadorimonas sp. 2012CJ34-2]MCL6270815.1 bifunctional DNA-formamidopyrimidine glycosylase/DNA-(apurinic or apyrimidinic site) lyase [Sansalvadorimonas sp. 2012CJ34-2]